MKDVVHSGSRSRALVDAAEAIGLVALILGALLALAVAVVPAAEPADADAQTVVPSSEETAAPHGGETNAVVDSFAVHADTSLVFALEVGNRMYPEWHEMHRVHLDEEFWLGDTENSAIVTTFLPDFRIIDGVPRSLSAALSNPAVRVYVRHQGAPIDSSWAFLNFPPHFSPQSFYTFQLKEVVGYPQAAAAEPAAPAAAEDKTNLVKRSASEEE